MISQMQKFERQQFVHVLDKNSGRIVSGATFQTCYFESCDISITESPSLRSTYRQIELVNCELRGCALEAAIVEDVLIDGLKTNGLFHIWGAVFKHVTLQGKIERIMLSPLVSISLENRDHQQLFDEANAEYYKTVDWALDISEAEFEECDIRSVPARLIRRDPETQVIITRERAMRGNWRQLDLSKTWWRVSLEHLLLDGRLDTVLVAPKRHRKFRHLLDGLKMLRDAGVAVPD